MFTIDNLIYKNYVWIGVANYLCAHERAILLFIKNTNTKITLKWEYKQIVTIIHSLFISLFIFIHDIKRHKMTTKKMIYTQCLCVSHRHCLCVSLVLVVTSKSIGLYIMAPSKCKACKERWHVARYIAIIFTRWYSWYFSEMLKTPPAKIENYQFKLRKTSPRGPLIWIIICRTIGHGDH